MSYFKSLFNPLTNTQSGTTYTLQASDNGKRLLLTSNFDVTITIPSGLGARFNCEIEQRGTGAVTFATSGTTLRNRQSHTAIAGRYGVVKLFAAAADDLTLSGDTA